MVAIEAAAHDLPTVAFATSGIVDAVAEGQSGHLVPPAITRPPLQVLADGPAGAWQTRTSAFAAQFAWPVLGLRMQETLQISEPTVYNSLKQ